MWKLFKSDAKYFVSFLGAFVVKLVLILYSTFLLLWITSFVDSGYLESEQKSKDLYSKIMIIAVVATLILLPMLGMAADRLRSTVSIPVSFFCRAICGYCFMFIT